MYVERECEKGLGSRVECCSDLRKCNARVEERRLIARNDRALYLELVVAVVILLSLLVVIQYNKQKSCFLSQLYC